MELIELGPVKPIDGVERWIECVEERVNTKKKNFFCGHQIDCSSVTIRHFVTDLKPKQSVANFLLATNFATIGHNLPG